MAKGNPSTTIFVLLGIVAILVFGMVFGPASIGSDATPDQTAVAVGTAVGDATFCANNPSLSIKVRIRDGENTATKSYLDGTVLIKNLESGSVTKQAVASSAGNFVTLNQVLDCKNTKGYDIYVLADEVALMNSDAVTTITPAMLDKDNREIEIVASQFSAPEIRVFDNNLNLAGKDTIASSTGYVSGASVSFGDNSGVGFFDGTTAEPLDLKLDMRAITQNRAFGTGMIIAIDSEDDLNIADYDENNMVVKYAGKTLTEATGLSENTLRALNSYEKIYLVNEPLSGKQSLEINAGPESSESSYDLDLKISMFALGDIESIKTSDVLSGISHDDSSSRVPVYTPQDIILVVN